MSNLYLCSECNIVYSRSYSMDEKKGWCSVKKRPTTMTKIKLDCSKAKAEKHMYGAYVYLDYSNSQPLYLQNDGTVRNSAWNTELPKNGRFKNLKEAEEALRRFKEKMCSKEKVEKKHLHLQLENETAPLVQPITARLVSDKSGGRIVLQVQTSETPEFIPIARLGVKNGKVVMYRERGVESEFINTDSEGRIQN